VALSNTILNAFLVGVGVVTAVLGRRAWRVLALVVAIPLGWWLTMDLSGGFAAQTASTDYDGAYALLNVMVLWLLTTLAAGLGAVLGSGIRWIPRPHRQRQRRPRSAVDTASAAFVTGVPVFVFLLLCIARPIAFGVGIAGLGIVLAIGLRRRNRPSGR
jgi:hypothetical protein